jgi:DNA-binding MarR family transcriptional regulator
MSTKTAAASQSVTPTVLPSRLRMAVMRLARRLRQESEGGASLSQLSALSTIDRKGPLTLGELAAEERIAPPSMTRIVARLEEQGLAIRKTDTVDRRVARVEISDEGLRYLAQYRTRRDAYLAHRLKALPAEERALLTKALPILEKLIEETA